MSDEKRFDELANDAAVAAGELAGIGEQFQRSDETVVAGNVMHRYGEDLREALYELIAIEEKRRRA